MKSERPIYLELEHPKDFVAYETGPPTQTKYSKLGLMLTVEQARGLLSELLTIVPSFTEE